MNLQNKGAATSWQSLLPWIDMVTPDLMLCKDGSLLAGFDFQCIDPDNLDDAKIDSVTTQIHRAFNMLSSRFTGWITATKLIDREAPASAFDNPISEQLDKIIGQNFSNGKMYSISHRFFLLYTGSTGMHSYMDSVQRLLNDEGKSFLAAIVLAANPATAGVAAALHDQQQLHGNIREFELAIAGFNSALYDFKMKRLAHHEFESALFEEANIASSPKSKTNKPLGILFDGWASQSEVEFGKNVVKVSGVKETKYVGQLTLKEYPGQLNSLMLESLLTKSGELKITHMIRFLDSAAARSEINEAVEYYKMTQFSLLSRIVAKATGTEPAPRAGKQDLLLECLEAQRRQSSENLGFVLHAMTISVYGKTAKECESAVGKAVEGLASQGFSAIRERLNLAGSFISMIPGQWSKQIRLNLQNTEAVADCLPIYTMINEGPKHPYFSELYGHEVPHFASFQDIYGCRVDFNPHVKQVGHMLVIAPTEGGKSTFVNFCISQFQRYGKVNTIIFDRDYSCKITTLLHGGAHIDLKSGRMKLNPLFALRDGTPDGPLWVREFIIRRLVEGGYIPNAVDRSHLDTALKNLAQSTLELRLSVVATQIPEHMRQHLAEWLDGSPLGMFDSVEDDFELGRWTCIEMKEIMSMDRIARAFLDYAFRRIESFLDGTPTFIYLEEASFLLNHPAFADVIDQWLKTLRKKNAFLWLTIQSPTAVTDSKMSATLLDNIKTTLILANKRVDAHREAYQKSFGMTDDQIDRIKQLAPQRDYMVIKDGNCRVLRTIFDKNSLKFLRSEINLQAQFEALRTSGHSDWKQQYLAQI